MEYCFILKWWKDCLIQVGIYVLEGGVLHAWYMVFSQETQCLLIGKVNGATETNERM